MAVYVETLVAERTTNSGSTTVNVTLPRQVVGQSGTTDEHLICELTLSWSRGSNASLIGINKVMGIFLFTSADTLSASAGFVQIAALGTNPPTGLSFDVNSNNPRFNFTSPAAISDTTTWVLKGSIWIAT
jgi:hypothetical protein